MINITIKTNGEHILDNLQKKDTTLLEVAVTLLRLEHIKQALLDIDFDSELEVRKDE